MKIVWFGESISVGGRGIEGHGGLVRTGRSKGIVRERSRTLKPAMCVVFIIVATATMWADDAATNIVTASGTLSNVVVRRAEPDALVIMSSHGIARVPFTELSADLQRQYGYKPELAADFQRQKAAEEARVRLEKEQARRQAEKATQITETNFAGKVESIWKDGASVVPVTQKSTYRAPRVVSLTGWVQVAQNAASAPTYEERGESVFIVGLPSTFVEGSSWSGRAYSCSQWQPTWPDGRPIENMQPLRRYAT